MFEDDSADMCARKFPLVSMRGQVEGLVCADLRARTPIFIQPCIIIDSPQNLNTLQHVLMYHEEETNVSCSTEEVAGQPLASYHLL